MRKLLRTLEEHDLGHLQAMAELWGFDPPSGSARDTAAAIANMILESEWISDLYESLPPDVREAFHHLIKNDGRDTIANLTKRFGILRKIGPGKRDREKTWRSPQSALEALWYRGLVGRAFGESSTGSQEYLYIPSDLLEMLPPPADLDTIYWGQPAEKPNYIRKPDRSLIDDATTLLAALRQTPMRKSELRLKSFDPLRSFFFNAQSIPFLLKLLFDESVLGGDPVEPIPTAARSFLERSRSACEEQLLLAWKKSKTWNDLRAAPGLAASGNPWPNDPLTTRLGFIKLLKYIPLNTWWDLDSFIAAVQEHDPGFQRPAGDFSSWYLHDPDTGEYLRGYRFWDRVEGALLRDLLTRQLQWLGSVQVGKQGPQDPISVIKVLPQAEQLFDTPTRVNPPDQEPDFEVRPDGNIIAPRGASRVLRYQIGRFCQWVERDKDTFHYRLTPTSLENAARQGLNLSHIRATLKSASRDELHPSLEKSLSRWEEKGREGAIEARTLLRVKDPGILAMLSSNKKTRRYLDEVISPQVALVHPRNMEALRAAAARAGILIDPPLE
jgi:hypothetical protein